uniref:glutathione synthase n=1 Tax=Eptatretus burgeri TaxID=7764 RepID=A0A8C4R526_EPTBU
MLERSRASCCPDIATQLAGTKKVQQELASSDALISSLGFSATTAARLQQTFTTMCSLDDGEDGEKAVQEALANPSEYVLKPQREGGGNNLYDEDIVHFFESNERGLQRTDRTAFILMHRLRPPPVWNVPIRPNTLSRPELCVSELGVFGAYVRYENNYNVSLLIMWGGAQLEQFSSTLHVFVSSFEKHFLREYGCG